jgi:hypothetical protein
VCGLSADLAYPTNGFSMKTLPFRCFVLGRASELGYIGNPVSLEVKSALRRPGGGRRDRCLSRCRTAQGGHLRRIAPYAVTTYQRSSGSQHCG